ncbi:GntR family transcriptional regulator [Paenibacillus sp. LMG 31456]|uniref:GntR family transcriptional regulator n=1 Tax=Paenibacillus foliorum TaxID=2654974 RepID=A0A972K0D5_9BACL|nr:GntR family transcriptional regulator [Paenibacillus foliorum]
MKRPRFPRIISSKHCIVWLFRRAGEKVNIDKLARDLEVSNIPIREALSRLSSEGFVGMIPY